MLLNTVSTCVSVCVSHAGVSMRNMQVTCGVLKSRLCSRLMDMLRHCNDY